MPAAAISHASRRVSERRLDLTEQRFEEWRCLMAIAIGTCLTLLVMVGEAAVLPYFIDFDMPYRVFGTQALLLIGATWGMSQMRPAIVLAGVAAIVLFLAIWIEADIFAQAILVDAKVFANDGPVPDPTALDVMAYVAGCAVVFVPIVLIALRVVRATPEERAIIALPKHRTFGFVSALQALFGAHPICMHLPSRGRRVLAIGLFALSQLMLGRTVTFMVKSTATIALSTVQVMEGHLPTLSATIHFGTTAHLIAMVVVPLLVFGVYIALVAGLRYGARRFSRTSLESMIRDDPRAPILFLRSFSDDQVRLERPRRSPLAFLLLIGEPRPTLDHVLLEEGTERGPVIAIGAPGSRPPFGAARAYISNDNWKQVVSDLARSSQAIVMALDETAGIAWELNEVHGNRYAAKVLHLLPPRLATAAEARRVVANMRATSPEVADLFGDLQRFLEASERPCVGWHFTHDGELIVLTTQHPSEASYRMAVRDYFYSADEELPEPRARWDISNIWKPGRLGIAAFAVATVALAWDFLLTEIVIASRISGDASALESSQVLARADTVSWALGAVAVALGIVGLIRRSPDRIFPILGILIGVWLIGSAALLR